MIRLGILYPPTGAESEYYLYGERLADSQAPVVVSVVGVRIFGDEEEHATKYLRRTADIDNLILSAQSLRPLKPSAAVWACTSGSFIRGPEYAEMQVDALTSLLECPVTSTSLAFVSALRHLDIRRVSVLSSYPVETASVFSDFLCHHGIALCDTVCMGLNSGPAAASLDFEQLLRVANRLDIPPRAALLVPDTAIPTMSIISRLELALNRVVLTANQVSLWETERLAGCLNQQQDIGFLFSSRTVIDSPSDTRGA